MSEAVNIPQLRFPEFREEWKIVKLTDIVDVMTDYVAAGSFESLRNNVTVYDKPNYAIYLRLTDLRKGIYHKDLKYVDRSSYDFLNKSNLCGGEILMANIGANVGDTYLMPVIDDFATIAPNMIVIKENRLEFLSAFLFYWLNTRKGEKSINTAISGSGQPKINKTDLKQIKISLTSQLEQAKIASFLTAVDNKIEQLSKKQELLGEYKKGVMQQIFSQAIRFKADDGSTFPEWKEKKLGDIVRFENGKGHEQNISKDGKFIVVNSKFISSQGRVKKYTDTQKSPLNFGDVVMVMSDVPNGKALAKCYYIEQDNLYSLNQRICGLKHKLADTKFIYYRINRHKYFLSFDSGVGQTNLKKMEILNCPLNIPTDIKEQAKIANFLSSVDNKIEQMGKQLDESKQFKKALLQQMFV